MKQAKMTIHPDYRIGDISPRLFGAFLEPIGSMVNGSMYNPKHPSADEKGLRRDFYGALREAGFCPITPDLTVSSFLDADEAMNQIDLWMQEEEREYAVIFFTDCWLSAQLIPRVAELLGAAEDWTSANLGN